MSIVDMADAPGPRPKPTTTSQPPQGGPTMTPSVPQPRDVTPKKVRWWPVLLATALVAALVGGSIGWYLGDSANDPEPAPVAAESTTEPTSEPSATADSEPTPPDVVTKKSGSVEKPPELPKSDRGHVIKKIGDPATVLNDKPPYETMAEFTIEKIEADPECNADPYLVEEPVNGHFIAVTVSASVAPGFSAWLEEYVGYGDGGMPFTGWEFSLIDADGLVVNEPSTMAAAYCIADNELMPGEVTDGQNATGVLVFDSPTPTGVLVYQPWVNLGDARGWEWEF